MSTSVDGHISGIFLNENGLSGRISARLGNLRYMKCLSLKDKHLSGEIPETLGSLANLKALYLAGKQLTGCIPDNRRDVPNNDFDELGLQFSNP